MIRTTSDVRSAFLRYFESNGHQVIPSGSLVPPQDPTLMFANAGMVQFKNVFTGRQKRPAPRATTVQKCIRISGKHNDLENVGRTSRHHTFFEMLGNFSFGDYFKQDACRFGWEFLTDVLGFDRSRLWVSVFRGDDNAPRDEEAVRIWTQQLGVPAERVLEGSAADNFWSMGDTGPCGPCSEIMYDRGERFGEAKLENGERFFEVWNLVFMQYMVEEAGGPMKKLPAPCIDTGAGLERIVSVLQNVESNYDIDLFAPLVSLAGTIAKKKYGSDAEDDVSMRVIADHARMAAHLISEGIFPEKTGREYVLRRVMRRAIRHGHRLGIEDLFLHRVAMAVVDGMGSAYPELVERRELIEKVCAQEEERFRLTLTRGLSLLAENSDWHQGPAGKRILPGNIAFELSATYGFPLDLVEVIGAEDGFTVDYDGYESAKDSHKLRSGAGRIGEEAAAPGYRDILEARGKTEFTGYDRLTDDAVVLGIVVDGASVQSLSAGQEGDIVLSRTPFYGESGGQVGDTGRLTAAGAEATVTDVTRPLPGLFAHRVRVAGGTFRAGDPITATVDGDRRKDIARHHTATHLLHLAIRRVLGPHATQKGSRVAPDSLRFDFTHFEALPDAQLRDIERIVAELVIDNYPVETTVTSLQDARATGAMALFEENYGDRVRLVDVGGQSRELCGGTHASRSGDVGPFFIVSEGGVAAGVRRIEAVCGHAAVAFIARERERMAACADLLKTTPSTLLDRVEKCVVREKELVRQVEKLQRELASGGGADLMSQMKKVAGVNVIGAVLPTGDPAALRDSADTLRQKIGSGVICLGGDNGGKAALVVAVTPDLVGRFHAGRLIGDIAKVVGGRGGGRPDLAQAGGTEVGRLADAVALIYDRVMQPAG